MSWLTRTLSSNSGRKMMVAITGVMLVFFLIIHLLGNLQIFSPSSAFNDYAQALHDGPLIVVGDVGMLILFPVHIALVIWLALDNRRARGGTGYKVSGTKQKRPFMRILASKSTVIGGLLMLALLIVHIGQMRLQHHAWEQAGIGGKEAVVALLSEPLWGALYVIFSLVTGWHVFHGFQAAFRSLGFNHNRYTPLIEKAGMGLGVILGLGFAAIPVWILIA